MGLFGFGDGKIDIKIDKVDVAEGDTVQGTATLTLNQDVKAKALVAEIFAERIETYYAPNGAMQRRSVKTYQLNKQLDVEKTYMKSGSPMQYNFDFVIPQVAGTSAGGGNPLGALGGVIGGLQIGNMNMNMMGPPIWYIEVKLEIEGLALPISKKVQINVVSRQQAPPAMS